MTTSTAAPTSILAHYDYLRLRSKAMPHNVFELEKQSATASSNGSFKLQNVILTDSTSSADFTHERISERSEVPTINPTNNCLEAAARLFGSIMRKAREQKPRAASDIIFEFFDTRYDQGDYLTCDLALQLINNISFKSLSDTILVAVLAATYPAKNRLGSRVALVDHAQKHLETINGTDEADFIINAYR